MVKKIVWILTDNKMGSNNLSLGVASFLPVGWKIVEKKMNYTGSIKLHNFLRNLFDLSIDAKSKKSVSKSFPDVVISCGRRLAVVSWWIKKSAKKTGKTVVNFQLQNPNMGYSKFDRVYLFNHDSTQIKSASVKYLSLSPNKITEQFLKENKLKWEGVFKSKKLKRPYVSLIVGGATKTTKFTPQMAVELATKANNLAKKFKGSLLVTTSRRTGEEQEQIIRDLITVPNHFYGWGDVSENPMAGYFACADMHIITGESISMVSECLATKAPVLVYDHSDLLGKKYKKFVDNFIMEGYGKSVMKSKVISIPKPMKKIINSAEDIADEIQNIVK